MIREANKNAVYNVVQYTIKTIYPKYYPTEVDNSSELAYLSCNDTPLVCLNTGTNNNFNNPISRLQCRYG